MSNPAERSLSRCSSILAVNLLFLMVWGFAVKDKLLNGMPSWFGDKFGQTFLATFPSLTATFWILTVAELLAFAFGAVALLRAEFLLRAPPRWLTATIVWSLFVFLQLGFGQWLTSEYNGAFQQFMYFSGTLVALLVVERSTPPAPAP